MTKKPKIPQATTIVEALKKMKSFSGDLAGSDRGLHKTIEEMIEEDREEWTQIMTKEGFDLHMVVRFSLICGTVGLGILRGPLVFR
jgi:hypothetical protein